MRHEKRAITWLLFILAALLAAGITKVFAADTETDVGRQPAVLPDPALEDTTEGVVEVEIPESVIQDAKAALAASASGVHGALKADLDGVGELVAADLESAFRAYSALNDFGRITSAIDEQADPEAQIEFVNNEQVLAAFEANLTAISEHVSRTTLAKDEYYNWLAFIEENLDNDTSPGLAQPLSELLDKLYDIRENGDSGDAIDVAFEKTHHRAHLSASGEDPMTVVDGSVDAYLDLIEAVAGIDVDGAEKQACPTSPADLKVAIEKETELLLVAKNYEDIIADRGILLSREHAEYDLSREKRNRFLKKLSNPEFHTDLLVRLEKTGKNGINLQELAPLIGRKPNQTDDDVRELITKGFEFLNKSDTKKTTENIEALRAAVVNNPGLLSEIQKSPKIVQRAEEFGVDIASLGTSPLRWKDLISGKFSTLFSNWHTFAAGKLPQGDKLRLNPRGLELLKSVTGLEISAIDPRVLQSRKLDEMSAIFGLMSKEQRKAYLASDASGAGMGKNEMDTLDIFTSEVTYQVKSHEKRLRKLTTQCPQLAQSMASVSELQKKGRNLSVDDIQNAAAEIKKATTPAEAVTK